MNNEKVKLNKSTKIVIIVCIVISLLLILSTILGFFSIRFSNMFWLYIRNPYNNLLYLIFQYIPFITSYIYETIVLIIVILTIIYCLLIRKQKHEVKQKYINITIKIVTIIIFSLLINPFILYCFDTLNNSITSFEKIEKGKEYTKEDLIALNQYLQKKVLTLSSSFERENGYINIDSKELTNTAILDLNNISKKYPFLKTPYPNKYEDISKENYINDNYEDLGITENFIIKIDNSRNSIEKLNTITHELCHMKGIMRESEAVYCSFQAGINSDNKYSQYAAYMEAFNRVNTVLYYIDSQTADDISDEIESLCFSKNYREMCDIYSKELNKYIYYTDEISILSYKLKDYKNNEKEFTYLLTKFVDEYNASIFIDEEEISLSEVMKKINKDSDKRIRIAIKNSEKTFNKISNLLIKYQDYFLSITQEINEEETDYMTEQELIEFYLYPYEANNLLLILFDEYDGQYEYEQVTRLLLNYYDY